VKINLQAMSLSKTLNKLSMKKITFFILYSILLLNTNFIYGQIDLPKDKVKVTFTVEQTNCNAYLVANISIVNGWHINSIILPSNSNSIPTQFDINSSKGIIISPEVSEPKPKTEYIKEIKETLSYHEGKFVIKRKLSVKSENDLNVSGSFSFQTCNEFKCLPVENITFNMKLEGCKEKSEQKSEVKSEEKTNNPESNFIKIKDDIATHKDGSSYVFVNKKWHQVPKGNSIEFYKKYLTLTQKDEK
jgi:hypothetical protein